MTKSLSDGMQKHAEWIVECVHPGENRHTLGSTVSYWATEVAALEADRDALVAYVRANGGNMVEAYEALSDELKELIDEGR